MFDKLKMASVAAIMMNTIPATRKFEARLPLRITFPPENPVTVSASPHNPRMTWASVFNRASCALENKDTVS